MEVMLDYEKMTHASALESMLERSGSIDTVPRDSMDATTDILSPTLAPDALSPALAPMTPEAPPQWP